MAGTQTGYSLDILADELQRQIEAMGGEIPPDIDLGISMGGRGVSLYDPETATLQLEQSPCDITAYEWTPTFNCRVVLASSNTCVEVYNSHHFRRKICSEGDSVAIDAGVTTKFSVISTSGSAQLKVYVNPA